MLAIIACTPAPRAASEPATEVVASPPAKAIEVASAEPMIHPTRAPTLRALVEDLALVVHGSVVQDSAQCFVGASWAASKNAGDLEPPDLAGTLLHLIDADGVSETRVPTTRELGASMHLRLATHNHAPSPDARMLERWLERRVPDATDITAWARAEIDKPLKIVGQVRGTFGGGVDRIVVLEPRSMPTMVDEDEEAWRVSEVAVLVAGDTPKGLVPFTRTFAGTGPDFEPGIYGLQVAAIVDLDGDGVEEIIWSSHAIVEDLVTELHASYFADGAHRVHELSSCSYWACNAVVPAAHCRGPVKDAEGGRQGAASTPG
jgi:hypothetical protein